MVAPSSSITYLFSDIEGSTRLWELEPERMKVALARHDLVSRGAVEGHRGAVVKMTGDGVHAAFDSAHDAVAAMLEIQLQLADAATTGGLALRIRCGLHAGSDERRDGDFYGPAVNRAARIMSTAHGGQMLLSEVVAGEVATALPDGVSLRDLGLARLRDLARPERIFQLVDPRLRTEFPALRSLEATPNNLPQQVDSFIGRERELADAKAALRATRLLTLLGMGGLGKSRLSIQLAADVLDDYPDGVWLVELAAIQDPRLVAQEVASVLGVKEEPGRPVLDALVQFVRDRQLLLVLDNCEHLAAACADLCKRLLQHGPRVRILATSRDFLQTAGETAFAVPPLAAPAADDRIPVNALARFESVRLFIDRASASQPGFSLGASNAAAVASICHRLDGIPLALELAAARMRALPVDAIATRLDDRFRLLTTGSRTVLPRQRTLRALIDWSYDLLPDDERRAFHRLSVFAGGWTLEAAGNVVGVDPIDPADVLDLVTRLVEKSLVVMDATASRYRFLDTVRHYAREKLVASGEEISFRSRHRDFFLALAEEARPHLRGPEQGAWFASQDLERENFHAAHAFGDVEGADADTGVRLVDALVFYWLCRGLLNYALRASEDLLLRPGLVSRSQARGRALFRAGQVCYFMGRHTEAIDYLAESLSIARELQDPREIAYVLQPLGTACLGEGALSAARGHLEEGFALAQELGDKREIALAANALAMVHRLEGNLEQAETLYRDVVSIGRQLGHREVVALGLTNLAILSIDAAACPDAEEKLLEVVEIAQQIGSKPTGNSALEVCAALAAATEDWAAAARFFGAAEWQIEQTGLKRAPADEAFLASWMQRARGSLGPTGFGGAEASGRALSFDEGLAEAQTWLVGRAVLRRQLTAH